MDTSIVIEAMQLAGTLLLHTLWQGVAVSLFYALSMLYLQEASPRIRYFCAVGWLAMFALAPLLTLFVLVGASSTSIALPGAAAISVPAIEYLAPLAPVYLPLLVCLWLVGVVALSMRMVWNWRSAARLTYLGCHRLGAQWDQRLLALARQIGVTRSVTLVESVLVSVPTVIGWLKPVILLPSSAMLGLSQRQLELLIAHELAHIVRYDYVVNYFLLAVQTLFFYHPVVYLLGRGIREERELCCDDLVISRCGGRYEYVTALTDIETLRSRHLMDQPLSNLAATGGDLLLRVQRIVKGTAVRPKAPFLVTTVAAVTVLMGGALVFNSQAPSSADGMGQAALIVPLRTAEPLRVVTETRVTAPAVPLAGSVVDVRAVALIGAPPSWSPPDRQAMVMSSTAEPAVRASLGELPSLSGRPQYLPRIDRDELLSSVYRPERAGPTHAMISELDLESPVLASIYDLRQEAGRALAVGKSPYAAVDRPSDESDYVVSEVAAASLREEGGALIKRIEPRYPSRARLRGYTDTVQIEFSVTDTGEVDDIAVVSANSKPVFERSVVRAVRKWRYEPLLRDGMPVERRVVETFAFRLDEPQSPVRGSGCMLDKNDRFVCLTPGVSRVL